MKVTFCIALKNLDGSPIEEGVVERMKTGQEIARKVVQITFASVCQNALLANFEDERDLAGDEKVTRFKLAQRIHDTKDKPLEISVEEAALLKKLIGKMYAPLVVGQVFDILEGKSEKA